MSKRDDLIALYAKDLRDKCGVSPDMDLLSRITAGLGPPIYNNDSATVSGSSASELATVKNSFLVKMLGLQHEPDLDSAIEGALEQYGRSNRHKFRAVVYYLLTKHFGREEAYA
jgi:hypothetical protein